MRRRVLLILLPLIALCAVLTPHALAQGTLDQSNTATPNNGAFGFTGTPLALAQTFTAGISGTLDSAALQVGASSATVSVTVSIYATSAGLPVGSPLASGILAIPQTAAGIPTTFPFATVTFGPGASVVAGQQYALVLTNPVGAGAFAWADVTTNPYPGGQALTSPTNGSAGPFTPIAGADFDFKTFVTVAAAAPAPVIVIVNPPVTLGIAIKGCGSLTPSAATTVNLLQAIPITAVPCPGSVFTGWTGGPCNGTKINPCDIAPSGVTNVTANFAP